MQTCTEWATGLDAWAAFVNKHPELGYRADRWSFHNFLRHFRQPLIDEDAIRVAKRRFWIAHRERFCRIAFACASGVLGNREVSA